MNDYYPILVIACFALVVLASILLSQLAKFRDIAAAQDLALQAQEIIILIMRKRLRELGEDVR